MAWRENGIAVEMHGIAVGLDARRAGFRRKARASSR
jgi:hypothetical protein